MLDLHKQLPKARTPHEQESPKRSTVTDLKASDLCGIRVLVVGALQPSEGGA
jgi:hypothetical protein